MTRDKLDPRTDPDTSKMQKSFVDYLDAYQRISNMPDSVVDDLIYLAGSLATAAMIYGYDAAVEDCNAESEVTFPEDYPCNGLPS